MGKRAIDIDQELVAVAPHRLPERIAELAGERAGCPIALYVLDIEGEFAVRLAGNGPEFPARIRTLAGVGPEIVRESMPQLRELIREEISASASVWPLMVRDRVLGFLLARAAPGDDVQQVADQAALRLEIGSGYTDAVHAARRLKRIWPAAEIQQDLLPPRLARVEGADIAGGVLPGYDAGGDFFDYASNPEGLWLAVGDATGKGNSAAAMSSLAVGALRAARRSGADLIETARLIDETLLNVKLDLNLTAVLALWSPQQKRLRWINCGHPPPLLLRADGQVEELAGPHTYALGLSFGARQFPVLESDLGLGDRLLLYSDGISERKTAAGDRIGEDGLRAILTATSLSSAAQTVRSIQSAVVNASPEALTDDATLLVVEPTAIAAGRPREAS